MIECPYCDRTYDPAACDIPTNFGDVGKQATVVCGCGQHFEVLIRARRTWRTLYLMRRVQLVPKRWSCL